MSVIAIARLDQRHKFSINYLKESIMILKNGDVHLFLRPFMKIEDGSDPVNGYKILLADNVAYEKDLSPLLLERNYMDPLAEEERFKLIDENQAKFEFEGYKCQAIESEQQSRSHKQWGDEEITEMELRFRRSLGPNAQYCYASYILLKIDKENTKLRWYQNEKIFTTECRRRKTSDDPHIKYILRYYDNDRNRAIISKHELWIAVGGNYVIETRPPFDQFSEQKESWFERQKRFHLPTFSKGKAARFVFESKNKKWLGKSIYFSYKNIVPNWIVYLAFVLAAASIILFLLFRFVWPPTLTIPKNETSSYLQLSDSNLKE